MEINSKNKKAFTIFETIVSLTILSIVITLIYSITFHDSSTKEFMILNSLENKFTSKNYSDFSTKNQIIKILKNGKEDKISVKKITYNENGIKIYKYELNK
ncbi:hypothetical protein CRU93_04715 [Arcobacter sp. CECT 8985]|nr:hypothetical protein CRU93_04715 [Arcobacter sp. CECT 8985]